MLTIFLSSTFILRHRLKNHLHPLMKEIVSLMRLVTQVSSGDVVSYGLLSCPLLLTWAEAPTPNHRRVDKNWIQTTRNSWKVILLETDDPLLCSTFMEAGVPRFLYKYGIFLNAFECVTVFYQVQRIYTKRFFQIMLDEQKNWLFSSVPTEFWNCKLWPS